MLACSQSYSLLSSASPPLLLGNLPWVRLNSFTASRIASHWASSLSLRNWLPAGPTQPPVFPELAAEREVEAEEEEREREREEPARKVQKIRKNGRPMDLTKYEEKWKARLEVCKEWKQTKGRFPKANKKDKEEDSLYKWLKDCKPGGRMWAQARWEKLNEAFGEGWEKECFPCLETGTWRFQPGNQVARDEAQ